MICLSCTGKTVEENIRTIERNREYIDIAEIRIDILGPAELELLHSLPAEAGLPCILNIGGAGEVSGLLENTLDRRWAFLDIDYASETESGRALVKKAESEGVRVIKTIYDASGVPGNLADMMFELSKGDRYLPRAEVSPRNSADLFKILDAHRELNRLKASSQGLSCINGPFLTDYIISGTGAFGLPARVMAEAWGSMLTYGPDGGEAHGEGGLSSPRDLAELFNYGALTENTTVFGIIGNPVMHTKSPALHNPALQKQGIDAVYLPFETADPELLLERAGDLNLKGLSVTIPHKQRVMELAGSLDESVEAIGACNTLVRDGQWRGYNTDWLGFLKPLENDSLKGRRALVIGAGGAAHAVVYALVSAGMDVTIVNRSSGKASALADDFGCRGGGFDLVPNLAPTVSDEAGSGFSLVVQTTSVGMSPDTDGNPLPDFDFRGVEIVYDIIYTPEKTAFLSAAEAAGCRIINGFPMLRAQAGEQFRLFTGRTME